MSGNPPVFWRLTSTAPDTNDATRLSFMYNLQQVWERSVADLLAPLLGQWQCDNERHPSGCAAKASQDIAQGPVWPASWLAGLNLAASNSQRCAGFLFERRRSTPSCQKTIFLPARSMQQHDYLWIVIVGGILAFLDAYGIGANDVCRPD